MAKSTLTSKGQVTIPKELRTKLGLREGDRLEFRLDEQGGMTVRPATEPAYRSLRGMLRRYAGPKPLDIEEMHQAVHEKAARKYGR